MRLYSPYHDIVASASLDERLALEVMWLELFPIGCLDPVMGGELPDPANWITRRIYSSSSVGQPRLA